MFKKTLTTLGIFVSLLFIPVSVFAEKIDNYNVNIQIEQNGDVSVVERITYNFENISSQSGFYRTIPFVKSTKDSQIKDLIVYKENEKIYNPLIKFQNNVLNLKIGDIDQKISGIHKYVISYKIERPFINKDDKENLYLNIVGKDISIPITNSSFSVSLPLPLSKNEISVNCYTNIFSEKNACPDTKFSLEKHNLINAFIVDSVSLQPKQDIILELSIPEKSINSVPFFDKFISLFKIYWPFFIVLICGVVFLIVWYKKRLSIKDSDNISPEYVVPENIHPLIFAGIIRCGKLKNKDFIASIVNLAYLGFISIEIKRGKRILNVKTDNDVYILKLEKPYTNTHPIDKEILDGIFVEGNRVPGDSVIFSNNLDIKKLWLKIKMGVKNKLVEENYFTKNLNRFNLDYHFQFSQKFSFIIVFTLVLILLSQYLKLVFVPLIINLTYIIISLILLTIFYFVFIYTYPTKTKKGILIEQKILGFKMYLSIAEKDRIHFVNPPEVTVEKFSEYLSYAIILGVENVWLKSIELPKGYNPKWWHDNGDFLFTDTFIKNDIVNSFGFNIDSKNK